MNDLSPPPFDHGQGHMIWLQGRYFDLQISFRDLLQYIQEKFYGSLRFKPTDQSPGINVSRKNRRNRNVVKTIHPEGVIRAHIKTASGGTGRRADQPQFFYPLLLNHAD